MKVYVFVFVFLTRVAMGWDAMAQEVTIGMRVDTPPFASIDNESGAYVGFFYTICTQAVTRAGYQFGELVPINAEQRNTFLMDGVGAFDLLCDPTTITLARMENFAPARQGAAATEISRATHLDFSQIIFVANGGYVSVKSVNIPNWQKSVEKAAEELKNDLPQSCKKLIAAADKHQADYEAEQKEKAEASNDDSSDQSEEDNDPFILFRYKPSNPETPTTSAWLLGYVIGSTIGEKVVEFRQDYVLPVPCTFQSHVEAAEAFCRGKLFRYYGDMDIIRASIAKFTELTGESCEAEEALVDDRTYEPYAFVISSRIPEFKKRFTCAIYSMFQDNTMDKLFEGHFGDGKTGRLDTLFWINSIPVGKRNTDISSPTVCGVSR